ncbi:ABC transporter ATP-binding protein [Alkalibaculum bacchi]|uniref:ABC transporter ATP-binding protein n=1 Tax=Alkalibaculum bacchi TaxID=645887 RepID=UPI0026F31065|nr:ABC transporter ATP-binding protein [Alkalibaculum bacchi]
MIEVRNISFSYDKNEILKNISFDIHDKEFIAVLGNNGAGKSTLITCLNRIKTPSTGNLNINGKDIFKMSRNEIAQNISYVAQKNELSHYTVYDSVLLGRKPYIKWSTSDEDLKICDRMLELVGMTSFRLKYVNKLSGGEVQKVMLARALVQQPNLLLLDEPTSNLDPKNQHEMMKLVKKMAREQNITVLIVIHDINLALRYCDKFLFLKDGLVYSFGDCSTVTEEILKEVYDIETKLVEIDGRKIALIE